MNKPLKKAELAAGHSDLGIRLPSRLRSQFVVLIEGTMPLITHAWADKQRKHMRDTHTKEPQATREAKDPEAEFEAAKYVSEDGWEGAPAHGLKGAFVEGARFVGGNKEMNMTMLQRALRVVADCPTSNLLQLYSPEPPRMREDFVRVGLGAKKTVDLRYRPEYWPWFLRVEVQYPSGMFSLAQIGDLINAAGSFNGFCEWRPGSPNSKTGTYGTFQIAEDATIKAFERSFSVPVRTDQ